MEAVGRLAGGVAHDFNNLMTAILGNAELLLGDLEAEHPMRDDIAEIRRAAERATSLTRQLLAFSRQQVLQPRSIDLNEILGETQRMLGRVLGEQVRIVTDYAADLPTVESDPGQIQQIVLNLALNARDAMPDGGTLRISTELVHAVTGDEPAELQPGDYILLRVEDDGHGIPDTLVGKVFEPFFTTKELGRGTGLGLSTVYGIVRQSGGQITLESAEHEGTVVRIWHPAATEVSPAGPATAAIPEASLPATANRRILLVEDEPAVRQLALRILQRADYDVIAASSGEEAIELAHRADPPIDLLLTDVVMPGMGGPELAQQLTDRLPGLKVLFMSGYTADASIRRAGTAFLEKPFSPAALTRKVAAVLRSEAG
jgi:two-component system, cell cycle sensor histidine kinase and response regulator CckA